MPNTPETSTKSSIHLRQGSKERAVAAPAGAGRSACRAEPAAALGRRWLFSLGQMQCLLVCCVFGSQVYNFASRRVHPCLLPLCIVNR